MKNLKKLFYRLLQLLSNITSNPFFYLQFQMDLIQKSINKSTTIRRTGGFYPDKRKICYQNKWDSVRRDFIVLALKDILDHNVEGDMVECGVYRGHTARLIHHYVPERKLFLMDTFDGFREEDMDIEKKLLRYDFPDYFKDTSVEGVFNYIQPQNSNAIIIQGRIPDSIPNDFKDKIFAFVHLDMDLYQPTILALDFFYPRMSKGGYIIIHDYNSWLGARKAVDEFFGNRQIYMTDKSVSALVKC
jgi:O-methyltransferase